MHKCYSNCAYMHNYCSSRIWYIYIYIYFFFFSLSTSCSLFLSPSDYLSSLIWSFSSSTLFFILSSLKSNNKLSNSSNVNQSRSQIHQALSSIYIYQTQIAKEEEENAAIVEEQGVEEEEVAVVAVNGEPQNHHSCSGKICPKSPPKLQTQNHWP